MKKKRVEFHLDGILALLIFGIFAACVLTVLLFGAKAYKGITRRDGEAYDQRTVLQYVATRVRQNDDRGRVAVTTFDGKDCLVLGDPTDEDGYVTRIYWHDGAVRELYAAGTLDMDADAGELILEADDLRFELTDDLLTVTADTHGASERLTIRLRSQEEVVS